MPDYRLYCIAYDGHIVKRHDYLGADDLAAIEQAQKLCGPHEIEVWEGARFIARISIDGNASIIETKGPHPD